MNGEIGLAILFFFYLSVSVNLWLLWNMFAGHREVHQKVDGQILYVQNQLLRRIDALEEKLLQLTEPQEGLVETEKELVQ